MPSDPTRHGGPRYTRGQRRLLTALAGLIVAALAGGAFALTYDALRDLALAGRVGERWAPLYPAMADTLTALTILSLVITRNSRWWTRLLRWALLLLLVSGGATLSVQHAVWGYASLSEDAVRAGVAVAPHVVLVVAVWLWLTMFKQIRVARPGGEEEATGIDRRGHVKVLEPAAADGDAEAAPDSPAFADEREPEREPLIPFQDVPSPPADAPAPEPERPSTTVPDAPAEDEPPAHEPAARPDPAPEADEPVSPEPPAYQGMSAGESLSSEPPPPLDALPEPRPAPDRLPGRLPDPLSERSPDPLRDPAPDPFADAEAEPPSPSVPAPRPEPPALLPTDVELVRGRDRDGAPEEPPRAATTRPDIVMPAPYGGDEEDHDTPPAERAEDPDAGEEPSAGTGTPDAGPGEDPSGEDPSGDPADDWNPPPSGSFRSGPTPPVD